KLSLELLVSRGSQQLLLGESLFFEETVETGRRQGMGVGIIRRQRQFLEQRGSGAMWVFPLEPFDELSQLRGDDAAHAPVPAAFRIQRIQAAFAVAAGPLQQRPHRYRAALGKR